MLCRVMAVSTSAYYDWRKRPGQLIDADTLHLYRRAKQLFANSRNSLGSREMMKKLREEGTGLWTPSYYAFFLSLSKPY